MRVNLPSGECQSNPHDHGPENFRELGVGQGQSPQAEVGGRVGHGAQAKLDGVDGLSGDISAINLQKLSLPLFLR